MTNDDKKDQPRGFGRAFKAAQKLTNNTEETKKILGDAEAKAATHSDKLKGISQDLQNLFRMTGAWVRGDYKKAPLQSMLFGLAAIVYFVNPFDVVSDFIPFVGYLDDVAVVGFVIRSIKKDIQEFLIWEKHT